MTGFPQDPVVMAHAMRQRWPVFITRVSDAELEDDAWRLSMIPLGRFRVWLAGHAGCWHHAGSADSLQQAVALAKRMGSW